MTNAIVLTPDSPLLSKFNFKPYRSSAIRRVKVFMPQADEPQILDINTPWGAVLTAKRGDMLLSELSAPDDVWPVDAEIFRETYFMVERGYCVKKAITMLLPMIELTGGDQDQLITVETLEGQQTVRAGDFFLARGVKGEIWSIPKDKVDATMNPIE